MKQAFLAALTKAIDGYLKLDPESATRLKQLQGKAIAIELLPFHFRFQCVFNKNSVTLHMDETIETDTQIRGTPLQMLGVMLSKDNRQRFFAEDVVIEGNAELGQQVIALFDELQIDWEEHLSQLVGDVPAYHISQVMRKMKNWLGKVETTLVQDVSEYVHEEVAWFPTAEALQDYFTDIDVLRMDVDRMEARVKKLKESLL